MYWVDMSSWKYVSGVKGRGAIGPRTSISEVSTQSNNSIGKKNYRATDLKKKKLVFKVQIKELATGSVSVCTNEIASDNASKLQSYIIVIYNWRSGSNAQQYFSQELFI